MMGELIKNYSLKEHNTFGIDAKCHEFFQSSNAWEIIDMFEKKSPGMRTMILGGGSNVLFTSDFKGIVIHPVMDGIQTTREDEKHVEIEVGAGEDWDKLVANCVSKGYWGLENLSLIPGNVGACPMQNIGAYGTEVKDHITHVQIYHKDREEIMTFTNEQCRFSYRSSIFKQELKGKVIILKVGFRLSKIPSPVLHYNKLKEQVEKSGGMTLENIRETIIKTRESKLPHPDTLPNAGSFFKNPVVEDKLFEKIASQNPSIPAYPAENGYQKLSAGWLIDQCGWKGKREGNVGCYKDQALVIVNHGKATGNEIIAFAEKIQASVFQKFGVKLEPEVNFI